MPLVRGRRNGKSFVPFGAGTEWVACAGVASRAARLLASGSFDCRLCRRKKESKKKNLVSNIGFHHVDARIRQNPNPSRQGDGESNRRGARGTEPPDRGVVP